MGIYFYTMESEKIYHISYVSTGCDCLKYDDIKGILEQSQYNNKAQNITGILVYCNKHFFQILEGEKDAVLKVFESILVDRRHDNVIKIQEGYIKDRNFKSWNMAFKSYNKELKQLDDFNNEQFYSYLKEISINQDQVSLKVLSDFFDLNG